MQTFLTNPKVGKYLQDLRAKDNLKGVNERLLRNVEGKEAKECFKRLTERIKGEENTLFYVVIDEGECYF